MSIDLLRGLLQECVETRSSDLHLSAAAPPFFRQHGKLNTFDHAVLSAEDVDGVARALMNPKQQAVYDEEHTFDLAYSLSENERFRVNIFQERARTALSIRRLEQKFKTLDEWNLPPQLGELAELRDGLVLVTGPTGSGKTTTLATLIHQINLTRSCHIITIEDPVEYIHQNQKSLVRQRELYNDVPTFADAVRAAMREDPNVILVGEMRDTATMHAAITAAETGHLVYSTLHTGDAVGALDRMIGVFPAEEQTSIRNQLSMVLRAVVAQRLLPAAGGGGRVPATEILRVNTAIAHLIRTGKPQQIYSSIELGSTQGMQTMEQGLADLVMRKLVEVDDARKLARDEKLFEERLKLRLAGTNAGLPGRNHVGDSPVRRPVR